MTALVVPYHLAEPLPALAQAAAADDAVIVSKGPAGAMVARLYETVAARVAAAAGPLTVIGGDAAVALATVAGLQRRGLQPGILWLSAHGAFHTTRSTRSGYLGGLALAMLAGRTGASLGASLGLRPVPGSACALIGARALDPAEREGLDACGLRRLALREIGHAALPAQPWYMHLDADLFDPGAVAPLRFPAADGPSLDEVAEAARTLVRRGSIAAAGVACTFTPAAFAAGNPLDALRPVIAALD